MLKVSSIQHTLYYTAGLKSYIGNKMNQRSHYTFWVAQTWGHMEPIPKISFRWPIWRKLHLKFQTVFCAAKRRSDTNCGLSECDDFAPI